MHQLRHIKFSLVLFLTSLIISSCGDDDSGPSFSFKDQNLQGTIDGKPFEFGDGTVDTLEIQGESLYFNLFDSGEPIDNVCNIFGFGEEVNLFFYVPVAVGVYELGPQTRTVTLFDPAQTLNIIVSSGAVEILSISEDEVTGRIDARFDGNSSVNGNFSAVYCTN